jgi:hypothetical protein
MGQVNTVVNGTLTCFEVTFYTKAGTLGED